LALRGFRWSQAHQGGHVKGVRAKRLPCGKQIPAERGVAAVRPVRLPPYIFHLDPLESMEPERVPAEDIARITGYIERSWGAERLPAGSLQAAKDPHP
jgi:hypothetical protein